MITAGPGEIAALSTALCWTASVMAFEAAGKRIGSLPVNLIRLLMGTLFLCLFGWWRRGLWLPVDADLHNWIWLSISGLIGLTLGDLCLFRAFILVGARISMLIMAFVPVISTLISWLFLGEVLALKDQAGMLITVAGIVMVVLRRKPGGRVTYPIPGLLLALGGAAGQAVGLVFSKYGMGDYDAFAANHIRLMAGGAGFLVIFSLTHRWAAIGKAIRNARGLAFTGIGAFFGPFMGISLSLYAVQHTQVGVAATLLALVPVLIIPASVIFKKEPIAIRDLMGAVIAVGGSALLWL